MSLQNKNHDFKFSENLYGGWLVPPRSNLGSDLVFPPHSVIGEGSVLGSRLQFGHRTVIEKAVYLGSDIHIGGESRIRDNCNLQHNVTLEGPVQIGNCVTVGDGFRAGPAVYLGEGFSCGADAEIEGVKVKRFLTIANVDGSGRSNLVLTDGKTVYIRNGCFFGNIDEFITRASKQNKPVYVAVMSRVAAALLTNADAPAQLFDIKQRNERTQNNA